MSALDDALAIVKQVHDNAQALADPAAVTFMAEMGFKQAVVDAIKEIVVAIARPPEPADAAPSSTEPATIAPSNAGV